MSIGSLHLQAITVVLTFPYVHSVYSCEDENIHEASVNDQAISMVGVANMKRCFLVRDFTWLLLSNVHVTRRSTCTLPLIFSDTAAWQYCQRVWPPSRFVFMQSVLPCGYVIKII